MKKKPTPRPEFQSDSQPTETEMAAALRTVRPQNLRRIVTAVAGRPWAVQPAYLDIMQSVVADHVAGTPRDYQPATPNAAKTLQVINGVGIVPIQGVIINNAGILARMSGATSPQSIERNFLSAMQSEETQAVMLYVGSPGGQVTGIPELADLIWTAKQDNPRPVVAFVDGLAASAAYWLASQADKIFATPSSEVGSIGIYSQITDTSRAERNAGEDSTLIKTGSNKATGIGPVTPEQIDVQQEIITQLFEMFTAQVERGRGMTLSDEMLTGRVYLAGAAQKINLVDGLATFEEVLQQYGSTPLTLNENSQ